jgi:hypothetical protein
MRNANGLRHHNSTRVTMDPSEHTLKNFMRPPSLSLVITLARPRPHIPY